MCAKSIITHYSVSTLALSQWKIKFLKPLEYILCFPFNYFTSASCSANIKIHL